MVVIYNLLKIYYRPVKLFQALVSWKDVFFFFNIPYKIVNYQELFALRVLIVTQVLLFLLWTPTGG